jgi:thiosulfate/3-mercaptopyruvate sulfurtransferase
VSPLVDTDWLAQNLGAPDLVVLDGSWYLPAQKRDAFGEYRAGHIPGALFFDLDAMSDQSTPLPHMLPPAGEFGAKLGALGVGSADRVVVYDGAGVFSAPRVWWMLRAMGHDAVFVLDGGLPKWKAEGRPLEAGAASRTPRSFAASRRPALIRTLEDMCVIVRTGCDRVVDARAAGRFEGREPEPRPGLASGHMPGSRNLPSSLLTRPDGTLKPPAEIRALFEAAGVDLSFPLVTSCGSGVTASALALALAVAGIPDVPVYDGSWAEWGADPALPVETGPARL